MGEFTLELSLGSKSESAIFGELDKQTYGNNSMRFLHEIGKRGVEVATKNLGYNAPYINVSYEVDPWKRQTTVTATDTEVLVEWDNGHSEEISPLLMAEFGSGFFAENLTNDPRGGQGKLNKYNHAFDSDGWYWRKDGVLHHSYGTKPTMPMYRAYATLVREIGDIAQRTFGSD